ncbi:hypothetical protein GYMLUDRAFT_249563 [Collybiopsis luxurians FD-317 M1]|uniref:Uncharacterized protein n=1 Tax=Collybiopsis luxurians FD-317 M1 TaxID=944289 RepID=A0A0D0AV53_9AGAR|nr:hypothetical protein GYMLUDRAFT_249563 [Collybiopsis luxurians FD-317 M1]
MVPAGPVRKEDAEVCVRLLINYHRAKPNYDDFNPNGPPINTRNIQREISRLHLPYCRNDAIEVPKYGRVQCEWYFERGSRAPEDFANKLQPEPNTFHAKEIDAWFREFHVFRISVTCKERGCAPKMIVNYPENKFNTLNQYHSFNSKNYSRDATSNPFTLKKSHANSDAGYRAPTRVWGKLTPASTSNDELLDQVKLGGHSISQNIDDNRSRGRSSSIASSACSPRSSTTTVVDVDSAVLPPNSETVAGGSSASGSWKSPGSRVTVKREDDDTFLQNRSVSRSTSKRSRWDLEGDQYETPSKPSKRPRSRSPSPVRKPRVSTSNKDSKSVHPPTAPRNMSGGESRKHNERFSSSGTQRRRRSPSSSRNDISSRTEGAGRSYSPRRSASPSTARLLERVDSSGGLSTHSSRTPPRSTKIQSESAMASVASGQPQITTKVETSEKTKPSFSSADITDLITKLRASKVLPPSISTSSLPPGQIHANGNASSDSSAATATQLSGSDTNADSSSPTVTITQASATSQTQQPATESLPTTAAATAQTSSAVTAPPAQVSYDQYRFYPPYGYPAYPPFPYQYSYPYPPYSYPQALVPQVPQTPTAVPSAFTTPVISSIISEPSISQSASKTEEPRIKEEPTDVCSSLTDISETIKSGDKGTSRMIVLRAELLQLRKEMRERTKKEKLLLKELAELNEKQKVDFVLGEVEEVEFGKLGLGLGLQVDDEVVEVGDRPSPSTTEMELQSDLLILQAQLTNERNGRRKDDQDRRDAQFATREAEHARDEAEHRLAEAERALREAEQRCRDAEYVKRELEHAKREAERAEREAVERRREAEQSKKDAEHAKRDSEEQRKHAEKGQREAEHAKREAEDRRREAEQAKRDLEHSKRKLEEQLTLAEFARRETDERRWAAEAIVEDIKRECKEPFVVPALLDAFLSVSRLTNQSTTVAAKTGMSNPARLRE